MFEEVIRLSTSRIIISKGWVGFGEGITSDNVKIIDYAPHSKLFPKMAAVVHHGGAGTVHAAACAGVPQIIIPQGVKQYFWGESIYRLKLGTKPVRLSKITSKVLLSAINEVISNTEIKNSAYKMGQHLQNQDGIKEAVEMLNLRANFQILR